MRKTHHQCGRRFAPHTPQFALAILASAGLLNAHVVLAQESPPAKPALETAARNDKDKPNAAQPPSETQTVIVTGTVGATQARRANVSYSVLDAKELGKFTPMSADDYLRDMPGVVVESNEGVARNESFTRGMTVGTGSPTSGNFWTAILEDGLPVVPIKFNNFQDSNFYRADISTSRVESVRGGSTGTSVASSAGGVFNFMSGGHDRPDPPRLGGRRPAPVVEAGRCLPRLEKRGWRPARQRIGLLPQVGGGERPRLSAQPGRADQGACREEL